MYDGADKKPILVASDSLINVLLPLSTNRFSLNEQVKVWPTITMDGNIYISSEYGTLIKSVIVYNSAGQIQSELQNIGYQPSISLYLPNISGIYYIKIITCTKIIYKKVVKS